MLGEGLVIEEAHLLVEDAGEEMRTSIVPLRDVVQFLTQQRVDIRKPVVRVHRQLSLANKGQEQSLAWYHRWTSHFVDFTLIAAFRW